MKIGLNTKLYTVKDLMKILNVSQNTIYRLTDDRKISFYRIKGSIRFTENDVLKYLEKNRIEPI